MSETGILVSGSHQPRRAPCAWRRWQGRGDWEGEKQRGQEEAGACAGGWRNSCPVRAWAGSEVGVEWEAGLEESVPWDVGQ